MSTTIVKCPIRFDFNAHREFKHLIDEAFASNPNRIELSFIYTTYIDSSALGYLLIVRDRAKAKRVELVLTNATVDARKVLEIANFKKLFTITY